MLQSAGVLQASKRRLIAAQVLAEAKALNINISQAAEAGLVQVVALRRDQRWLAENKAALESSNACFGTHGLPLARYRTF